MGWQSSWYTRSDKGPSGYSRCSCRNVQEMQHGRRKQCNSQCRSVDWATVRFDWNRSLDHGPRCNAWDKWPPNNIFETQKVATGQESGGCEKTGPAQQEPTSLMVMLPVDLEKDEEHNDTHGCETEAVSGQQ